MLCPHIYTYIVMKHLNKEECLNNSQGNSASIVNISFIPYIIARTCNKFVCTAMHVENVNPI